MNSHCGRYIFVLAIALSGCTRNSESKIPLGDGMAYVEKRRSTPQMWKGPSVEWSFELEWADGRREHLPKGVGSHFAVGSDDWKRDDLRINVLKDSVWIVSSNNLLVRDGGRDDPKSRWFAWQMVPSDELFGYMDDFAKSNGDRGVRRVGYTISKRLGEDIVSGVEIESLTTLIYKDGYSISPSRDRGSYLPHRIDHIAFDKRIIFLVSNKSIDSMPKHLVFRPDYTRLGRWRFDRSLTQSLNGG